MMILNLFKLHKAIIDNALLALRVPYNHMYVHVFVCLSIFTLVQKPHV